MTSIRLTRGYSAIVDDLDVEWLNAIRWRALVQGAPENLRVYAVHDNDRMHRLIWARANGPIPDRMEIDHIDPSNFCGLDNRRSNLRLCTKSQNQANSRLGRNNTSGYKGVWWHRQAQLWCANIWVHRKKISLGYFDTKEAAGAAYDAAALTSFGDHARTNFPQEAA